MKIELEAYPYEKEKKGDVRRLRNQGKIPGILYGHKEKNKRIYVIEKEFQKILNILKKEAITIDLKIGEKKYPSLIKSLQHNPITGKLLHVDFQHILKEEKIRATIPIHLIGESPGVKKGGLLDQHLHEVVVRCLPDDLPSHLDVDISNLDLGKTIHLKEIKKDRIEFEMRPDTPVVSILASKVAKPAPAPAPESPAAPEVKAGEEGVEKTKEAPPKKE